MCPPIILQREFKRLLVEVRVVEDVVAVSDPLRVQIVNGLPDVFGRAILASMDSATDTRLPGLVKKRHLLGSNC